MTLSSNSLEQLAPLIELFQEDQLVFGPENMRSVWELQLRALPIGTGKKGIQFFNNQYEILLIRTIAGNSEIQLCCEYVSFEQARTFHDELRNIFPGIFRTPVATAV